MNALEDNLFTQGWKDLARKIPAPKAILCVSAHWYDAEKTAVTGVAKPETIHDFYGFPEELYSLHYPAPGSPALARRVEELTDAKVDTSRGLDHGTWSVLMRMYPKADIPIVQLSLDLDLPLGEHYALGERLAPLRDESILIIGSGNIVHNLGMMQEGDAPYSWALDFDKCIKKGLESGDADAIINYTKNKSARMAHPTNDHYLPLLYVLGASTKEKPQFFNEYFAYKSMSMRCVAYGLD